MAQKTIKIRGKRDGFYGQRAIVIPKKIQQVCYESPLIKQLFITDIGFYPKAKHHFRKRPHGSPQNILIYCVDGKGWLKTSDKCMDVVSGQFIIIPAHTVHQYGSYEEDPWSIYWLHFKGEAAAEYASALNRPGDPGRVFSVDFLEERIRLFDAIYQTLESGYSANNLGYINACLWYFLGSFCYSKVFLIPQNKKDKKEAIEQTVEFMKSNLHRSLTIEELAKEAGLSSSHFAALFKRKTGYPPLEYFNHIKVQKACQFLHFTNLKIKDIANEIGIDDPYYFSRFFTNIMGVSPLNYRKKKH